MLNVNLRGYSFLLFFNTKNHQRTRIFIYYSSKENEKLKTY